VQQPVPAQAQTATTADPRLTDSPFSAAQDARLLELKRAHPNSSWKDIGAELGKPHWACKNRYKQLTGKTDEEEKRKREKSKKHKGKEKEIELESTEGWTKDEVCLPIFALTRRMFLYSVADPEICIARPSDTSGVQDARRHVATGRFSVSQYHWAAHRSILHCGHVWGQEAVQLLASSGGSV
jgi:hypothetical protein